MTTGEARLLRSRPRVRPTTQWSTRANLTRYDAARHVFQSDLKASTLGWVKGESYPVALRELVAASDPQPPGSVLQGSFDRGSRSVTIQ